MNYCIICLKVPPWWDQQKIELVDGLNHKQTDYYFAVGWNQPNIEPVSELNLYPVIY